MYSPVKELNNHVRINNKKIIIRGRRKLNNSTDIIFYKSLEFSK